jgi:hypothetical protein
VAGMVLISFPLHRPLPLARRQTRRGRGWPVVEMTGARGPVPAATAAPDAWFPSLHCQTAGPGQPVSPSSLPRFTPAGLSRLR